jgi:hypothetical protein
MAMVLIARILGPTGTFRGANGRSGLRGFAAALRRGSFNAMTITEQTSIAENLAAVRERIAAAAREAGRDPAEVTLVAVGKTHIRSSCCT